MAGLRARLARQRARKRDADAKTTRFTDLIRTQLAYLAQRPRLAAHLARKFNLRFTSGFRTKAHNAAVGGVPNSWHTRGTVTNPGAIDLVGTAQDMAAAREWARANVHPLAEALIHNVGSGQHLHLGGTGVMEWRHPDGGRLKRWRAGRDRQRKRSKHAEGRIARLKQLIANKPVPAKGIDVSVHQGTVDFAKVKAAGYAFVWVKASEGQDFTDSRFRANVTAARAAGLKVGAYHFLRPRPGRTGAVEARWFLSRLSAAGLGKGDLLPVVDVESTRLSAMFDTVAAVPEGRGRMGCYYHEDVPLAADVLATSATQVYVREFCDTVETELGFRPLIYTFPSFMRWTSTLGCKLWVAHFGVQTPTVPSPWTRAVAHQHSEKGQVPGVTGNCDLNKTQNLRDLIA